MVENKKQTLKFNEEELLLIKNTFAENEELVKVIRKALLQLPLSAVDLSLLQLVKGEIIGLLKKALCPTITGEEPLLMVADHFTSIGLRELQPAIAGLHLRAIQIWKDYMEQELNVLGKDGDRKIKVWELGKLGDDDLQNYVNVFARNNIINGIETGLYQLYVLAGNKEETPEQTLERIHKNSNK